MELSIDPATDRARARAEAAATKLTLHSVERYLEANKDVVRPATMRAARWHFGTLWAPLHKRPIEAIRRADVASRLGEIIRDHGRISAKRARAAMYVWAIKEALR